MSQQMERRSSNWIPWMFVAMFMVVFAANGVMLTFALKSFNGLWTDGAYDRGLSYNETLAERQDQLNLDWQVALDLTDRPANRTLASLTLMDGNNAPLHVDKIAATVRRPASAEQDFSLVFRHTGRGLYEANIDWPQSGLWEIRLVITSGTETYRLDKRLTISRP